MSVWADIITKEDVPPWWIQKSEPLQKKELRAQNYQMYFFGPRGNFETNLTFLKMST